MSVTTARSGPREDRRSKRTRHMIQSALVQLMMGQRYDEITVQDIIEQANVGRSTFYSHYLDKDDLLQREVEQVVEALAYHMDERPTSQTLVPSLELFRHFRDSQALIRALTRGRAIEPVLKTMESQLTLLIEGRLAAGISQSKSPRIPLALVAQHIAATLLMLAQWWLDRDMQQTPEQVDDYFLQLVRPSIREVTGLEI
jgi:AcrR family transcriptional regulator